MLNIKEIYNKMVSEVSVNFDKEISLIEENFKNSKEKLKEELEYIFRTLDEQEDKNVNFYIEDNDANINELVFNSNLISIYSPDYTNGNVYRTISKLFNICKHYTEKIIFYKNNSSCDDELKELKKDTKVYKDYNTTTAMKLSTINLQYHLELFSMMKKEFGKFISSHNGIKYLKFTKKYENSVNESANYYVLSIGIDK